HATVFAQEAADLVGQKYSGHKNRSTSSLTGATKTSRSAAWKTIPKKVVLMKPLWRRGGVLVNKKFGGFRKNQVIRDHGQQPSVTALGTPPAPPSVSAHSAPSLVSTAQPRRPRRTCVTRGAGRCRPSSRTSPW